MPLWKDLLIGAYYSATLSARRRAASERAAVGAEPVQVLFYHRVADAHPNDWTMSCRDFERQIDWIAERYEVVGLQEAQQRIRSGCNRTPTACLTFDDGYADNCDFALPQLLRRRLPFTYFVSTNHVLRGEPFAHDIATGLALRPNTLAELKSLANAGVEIGAHTVSHADVGRLASEQEVRHEIVDSKLELQEALGREVRYFAFPFGLPENMTQLAFRVAHQAGYVGVCSAYGAYNWPGEDPFHLRRIHADPGMARLKNWMTVDPRKVHGDQFVPGDYLSLPFHTDSPVEVVD